MKAHDRREFMTKVAALVGAVVAEPTAGTVALRKPTLFTASDSRPDRFKFSGQGKRLENAGDITIRIVIDSGRDREALPKVRW